MGVSVHIDPRLAQAIVFVATCVIIWWPGNVLIWQLWRLIARFAKVEVGVPTRLAPIVGGLERVLYVFAVMSGKYEVITGWLVMKAFSGGSDRDGADGRRELRPAMKYRIHITGLFLVPFYRFL